MLYSTISFIFLKYILPITLCLILSQTPGLSDVQGLELVSDIQSPIVFLKLKNSSGCLKGDLQVLEDIADRVSDLKLYI